MIGCYLIVEKMILILDHQSIVHLILPSTHFLWMAAINLLPSTTKLSLPLKIHNPLEISNNKQYIASNVMRDNDNLILELEGYHFHLLIDPIYHSLKSFSALFGLVLSAKNPHVFLQLKVSLYTYGQFLYQLLRGLDIH